MTLRLTLLFLLATASLLPQTPAFEGTWFGALDAGPIKLRLALHLSKAPGGGLAATLDSLDQNAKNLPAGNVTTSDRSITVPFPALGASFEATLTADEKQLAGTFHQGGAALPLTLAKVDKVPEKRRPQEPAKPYPYTAQEVSYASGSVKLAGTLTLPRGKGPHPAVLLITGSGAQDRDETVAAHKPFLVLADYLTRRGIAVLRMDDRGVGGSTGNIMISTEDDFAADALAGVAFLKTHNAIDRARIGLLGHSEGGLVAALAASGSKDVAFVVLMAAPGIRGDRLIVRQVETAAQSAGLPKERIAEAAAMQRKVLDALMGEKDNAAAVEKMAAIVLAGAPEQVRKAKTAELRMMTSPWYRSLISTDPRPALAKIRVPVLAMTGELDSQVAAAENLDAIAAALKEGRNQDATCTRLPGLNHLFQKAKSGAVAEYGEIEETINPEALRMVGDWIASRTARLLAEPDK